MNKDWDLLISKAQEFGIVLSEKQVEQFKVYWQFLYEYNQHTNLVSKADMEIVIPKHFVDSLAIGLLKDTLGWDEKKSIIDIGIGGGFPSIPILIANPAWTLCAVDSVGKKTKFISLLAQELGISDRVEVINDRAEELAHLEQKRENFDIVVSRAVGQLSTLAEYCIPFVKKGGYFIAYKSKNYSEELEQAKKALHILGGELDSISEYNIPDVDMAERNLICTKKMKSTSVKYPRRAGFPKKSPL